MVRHQRWVMFVLLILAGMPALAAGRLKLVSSARPEDTPDTAGGLSWFPQMSADGRFVAFISDARNLVPGQVTLNTQNNVFLYDRLTGTTTLVSHAAGSPQTTADSGSGISQISADGAFVLFGSRARNLLPGGLGDAPDNSQVYLFERATGEVTLVSRRADGKPGNADSGGFNAISADGGWILYRSQATDLVSPPLQLQLIRTNVFLYERATGRTMLVSRSAADPSRAGNDESDMPTLSADGRFAAYVSLATDLVTGQLNPVAAWHIFLFDRLTGTNTLATHAAGSALTGANSDSVHSYLSLSADGRYLAYTSSATDLVSGVTDANDKPDVFLYDRLTNSNLLAGRSSASPGVPDPLGSNYPIVSADGSTVAYFQGEGTRPAHAFLFDRTAGTSTLATRSADHPGEPASAGADALALSDDGRYLLFASPATDLIAGQIDGPQSDDIFLHDRAAGTTVLVSHVAGDPTRTSGRAFSGQPGISADGSWAVFGSDADDLDANRRDSNFRGDVFLYERATATNRTVSLHAPGLSSSSANGRSFVSTISGDGRYVAFASEATNLIPGQVEHNSGNDVFLYDRIIKRKLLVSGSAGSRRTTADGESSNPQISRDGLFILFESQASDLVPGQIGQQGRQLYLFSLVTGRTVLVSRSHSSPLQGANGASFAGGLSADGSVVAFTSEATDLVAGQRDANSGGDVFAFDRRTGTVTLLSHARRSARRTGVAPSFFTSMSLDGNWIAFSSFASNLAPDVPVRPNPQNAYLCDRRTGAVTLLSKVDSPRGPLFGGGQALLSADGRYAVFKSDTGSIRLFDRATASSTLVLRDLSAELRGFSDDGRHVLFRSYAGDLVPGQDEGNTQADLFLLDRLSGEVRLASHVPGEPERTGSFGIDDGRLSGDGRWAVFSSFSPELLPAPPAAGPPPRNVFLYDRTSGEVTLLSRPDAAPTESGNLSSAFAEVSAADGFVSFGTEASNLVPEDFNGSLADILLYVPE